MPLGIGIGLSPLVRHGSVLNLCDEYKAVLTAMPTQPSESDRVIQNAMVKELVDRGYWSKIVVFDNFSTHSSDSSLINWKTPGTFNPSAVNTPDWEQYGGYKGANATTKYIRTNFNPSTNGGNITKENITIIVGVGEENNDGLQEFGASDGTNIIRLVPRTNTNVWTFILNGSAPTTVANTSAIGHFSASRNTSGVNRKKNILPFGTTSAVGANIINKELYACGYNSNGTAVGGNTRQRYILISEYLTDFEVNDVVNIIETYLRNYSKGLIEASSLMYPDIASKANANLTTFVGFENETIHPSVLDIGYEWNGYRYWMANTPYPKAHLPVDYINYEIPCIWASTDGKTWVVPDGLTNPIDPLVPGKFSPDTDLFFDNGVLYCFFAQDGVCKFLNSTDGITWTNKTVVTNDGPIDKSQSHIKIGSDYYIYYTYTISSGVYGVRRIKSSAIDGSYTGKEDITITGLGSLTAWHIDIVTINSVHWMSILSSDYTQLFVARSTDGINFTVPNSLRFLQNVDLGCTSFYRPSLMKIANGELLFYHIQVKLVTGIYETFRINVKII